MDTSTNMAPPSTALSKLEFVKYDGEAKHEHAMLCRALQTILEDAFHPMRKKQWTAADSEIYHQIDKNPTTLTLKELQQLILTNVRENYARPALKYGYLPVTEYHETFLMEFGIQIADSPL
jgi:hypothetical protein